MDIMHLRFALCIITDIAVTVDVNNGHHGIQLRFQW